MEGLQVFKFGGASVKDADSIRNVQRILAETEGKVAVIISAMGKTTNALERVVFAALEGDDSWQQELEEIQRNHLTVVQELYDHPLSMINKVSRLVAELRDHLGNHLSENTAYEYDQVVSYGELLSTMIIEGYIQEQGLASKWYDARYLIRTDRTFREAKVDWDRTGELLKKNVMPELQDGVNIAITQGFIGHTAENATTTLGREGSDFSAAILAYCLDAERVTIWKDVDGMLNADPRKFENTQVLPQISYKEAVELAYFGASVIHPKTIKPLQNKDIPLCVRSFIDPSKPGTVIHQKTDFDSMIPSYIIKEDQAMISINPRDYSFIVEEHLEELFGEFNKAGIRINIMQNSALSFSIGVDAWRVRLDDLHERLSDRYQIRFNQNLQLVTIRHYDESTIETLLKGKKVFMEQRSRNTARFLLGEGNG